MADLDSVTGNDIATDVSTGPATDDNASTELPSNPIEDVIALFQDNLSLQDNLPPSLLLDLGLKQADDGDTGGQQQPVVTEYLCSKVPIFARLRELRMKGWKNPKGDDYFERQRYISDNADGNTTTIFMKMMRAVGRKAQEATGVFTLPGKRPNILALGFAPGGKIETAMDINKNTQVSGITLGVEDNGIKVLVRKDLRNRMKLSYADLTMMITDLGFPMSDVPADHPDTTKFRTRLIRPRAHFDLATCEGGVLRTHARAEYRESREAHRLRAAQLALALERVKPGGSMLVLLHHAESFRNICLFHNFSKFAKVTLFKPDVQHQHRSSFYMIAMEIQSQSEEAANMVRQWKREWHAATFGSDEVYDEAVRSGTPDVDAVLAEFGEHFVEMASPVWAMQVEGLGKKSFTQEE
ncbi:Uu.00g066690.m01.CDS01 [Anthostomella pinea]|uniref:Uu.00g066690.m01.CDS01 n=1 Tax=Anthostomella pinea TaxID=933095 RepID=A0AAI8YN69_9PEZI|nr:Uu.00g066690.m01.CDS01 [Anthostomella pinea]